MAGLFGSSSSPFDQDVDKITNEKNTSEDWGLIMDLCDRVGARKDGPRECLKSISKRLQHNDPHVVIQAITLLDACANNCGKPFKLEIASRDFEKTFKKVLQKHHNQPKVLDKLKAVLKRWAEKEFKGDQQLNLIPSLYQNLKREGVDFSGSTDQPKVRHVPKDPNVVSSQQEEDDIAKAIQMSLKETKATPETKMMAASGGGVVQKQQQRQQLPQQQQMLQQPLYPMGALSSAAIADPAGAAGAAAAGANGFKEPKKARALYDFEAAEDNELTFQAGEIVIIIDSSDVNWWKGSNHRGEGLFPANFVTTDLNAEPEKEEKQQRRRSVQFSDSVEVKTLQPDEHAAVSGPVDIDEDKIDHVLMMLNEADPASGESDPSEMPILEEHVNQMGPLIDAELEGVDRRLAQLTRLSTELVDALNLYHQLMRELPAPNMYASPQYANPYMSPMSHQHQQQMMGSPYGAPPMGYMPSLPPATHVPASGAMPAVYADPYAWNPAVSGAPPMQYQMSGGPVSMQQNGYAYHHQLPSGDLPQHSTEAPVYTTE